MFRHLVLQMLLVWAGSAWGTSPNFPFIEIVRAEHQGGAEIWVLECSPTRKAGQPYMCVVKKNTRGLSSSEGVMVSGKTVQRWLKTFHKKTSKLAPLIASKSSGDFRFLIFDGLRRVEGSIGDIRLSRGSKGWLNAVLELEGHLQGAYYVP